MVASADPQQPAHTKATGGFINGADPLDSPVGLFLLQVVIIMATTRVLALGLSYLKQPRVIAEILAGIILGPSGLGAIPGWLDHVFPKHSLPYLSLVANVGLVLYMYVCDGDGPVQTSANLTWLFVLTHRLGTSSASRSTPRSSSGTPSTRSPSAAAASWSPSSSGAPGR